MIPHWAADDVLLSSSRTADINSTQRSQMTMFADGDATHRMVTSISSRQKEHSIPYSNPYHAMRKALSRVCHRLNGALCLGLVTLCLAHQPMPRINVKVPDILENAMWAGCKAQGLKRLKAHFIGNGWH